MEIMSITSDVDGVFNQSALRAFTENVLIAVKTLKLGGSVKTTWLQSSGGSERPLSGGMVVTTLTVIIESDSDNH